MSLIRRSILVGSLLAALVTAAACQPPGAARYSRQQAQTSLKKLGAPGLILGEFHLTKVTDGDTIRVDGLDSSLRLIGLDAEETFKNEPDRRGAEGDFDAYLREKRGGGKHPVKAATPLGEDAKNFAKQFFHDHEKVRIERDVPGEIRDRYDRYLAYVFAEIDGKWVNYNVECVRAGMSPYFMKYGYSQRFHADFVAAEAEAKAAKRGIWDPTKQHYPDYDERARWWTARAEFIARYQPQIDNDPNFIVLTHWDAMKKIEDRVGQEVAILATVGDIKLGDRGPTKVMLSRKMFGDFPLVFFDKDVFASTGVANFKGEFIVAKGVVTTYTNKYTKKKQFQIQIDRAGQLLLPDIPEFTPPQ